MLAHMKPINLEESVLNLNRKAMRDLRANHPEKTLYLLKEALSSTHPLNSCGLKYKLLSITLNNLGFFFKSTASYKKAASCLSEALECEERIGEETELIASTQLNFSSVLSALGQHERALRYALKTVQQLKKHTSLKNPKSKDKKLDTSLVIAYHNSGIEYEHLKMPADAIDCYLAGYFHAVETLGTKNDLTKAIRRSLDILQCKLGIAPKIRRRSSNCPYHGFDRATITQELKEIKEPKHKRSVSKERRFNSPNRHIGNRRKFSIPFERAKDTSVKSSPVQRNTRNQKPYNQRKDRKDMQLQSYDHSELVQNRKNSRFENESALNGQSSSSRFASKSSYKTENPFLKPDKNSHTKSNSYDSRIDDKTNRKYLPSHQEDERLDEEYPLVNQKHPRDNEKHSKNHRTASNRAERINKNNPFNSESSKDSSFNKLIGKNIESNSMDSSHTHKEERPLNGKQASQYDEWLLNSTGKPFQNNKYGRNLNSDHSKHKRRLSLNLMIPAAVTIQAWWKGVLVRKKYEKECIERKIKITKLSIRNAEKGLVQMRKDKNKFERGKSPSLRKSIYKYKIPHDKFVKIVIKIQRFIRSRAKTTHKSQKQSINLEN